MELLHWGLDQDELKFAWRLCRFARKNGKYRPIGAFELKSDTDTGFLYRKNGNCYIVIDGSSNLHEWVKNFFWFRVGRKKEAAGFLVSAVDFTKQIEQLLYENDSIRCVGHSRGGAIAQSIALELSIRKKKVETVVSFGSPKVGGFRFARYCRLQEIYHVRVFTPADIVPKLPRFRGSHFSTVDVTFDKKGSIFDFALYRVIRGVVEHLSYGYYLKYGNIKWK
jgi:pimeloyl-ACP methyl ester carboxylesterase